LRAALPKTFTTGDMVRLFEKDMVRLFEKEEAAN
jgi:hypothetical protein